MRLEDLIDIIHRWVLGSLLFQPVLEAQQNLEALVVRWALNDLDKKS